MRPHLARLAPILMLGATVGCRPGQTYDMQLDAIGSRRTTGVFTVSVTTTAAAEAALRVDGQPLSQTVPTNAPVTLDLSSYAEGTHSLTAGHPDGRPSGGSRPLQLFVDRTRPTVTSVPAAGMAYTRPGEPFRIEVQLNEEIEPSSVTAATFQLWAWPAGSIVETIRTVSADRRRVLIEGPSLQQTGSVYLVLDVADLAGNVGHGYVEWTYTPVQVWLQKPAGKPPVPPSVSGVVDLVANWWNPLQIPRVDLLVDGAMIGTTGADTPYPWDSRMVADGLHRLEFRTDGLPAGEALLSVENLGPVLVSCTPRVAPGLDALAAVAYDITFSQPICFRDPSPIACFGSWSGVGEMVQTGPEDDLLYTARWAWSAGAAGPGTHPVGFASAKNRSGQPLRGPAECTMTIPEWRAPLGEILSPELGGGGAVVLDWSGNQNLAIPQFNMVRIAPPAAASPGVVEHWRSQVAGGWIREDARLSGAPYLAQGRLQSSDGRVSWLERGPEGDGRIRSTKLEAYSDLPTGPETLVTIPAVAGPIELAASGLAWTQLGPGGKRQLIGLVHSPWPQWTTTPPANVDSSADASPGGWWSVGSLQSFMAYVETPTVGVGQLRVREFKGGAWTSVGEILNRDPTLEPSEPAVSAVARDAFAPPTFLPLVVWVEGGQVLARNWTGPGGWSTPQLLNGDPAATARSPRFFGSRAVMLFVERDRGGDRIEVRQFDAATGAWLTLPAVSTGTDVVAISTFSYAFGFGVLWEDSLGVIRLRVKN
jgi:hypothetical protein